MYIYDTIKMALLGLFDSLSATGAVPFTKVQLLTYTAIACIVIGLLFCFVGFGFWKVLFRVVGFFAGFAGGFVLYRVVIEKLLPILHGLLWGHLDIVFGVLLGVVAFFLAEHLIRLGVVAFAAVLGWMWVPYLVELFLPGVKVAVPYLFDIVGILLGVLVGYFLARPLFRPALVVVSAAIAGFGIVFGAMVFLEGALAPVLTAPKFEWVFQISAYALTAILVIVRLIIFVHKRNRAQEEAEA